MKNERRIMRGMNALLSERGFQSGELLPPQQAVIAFLARVNIARARQEAVPIETAAGRILAEDIAADRPYPAIARSTMDGFAVRSADLPGTLRIAGEVLMGRMREERLAPGESVRIPTGGALPEGADAVVPVEDTVVVEGSSVRVERAVPAGDCLTQPGDDMQAGEVLLHRGRRIGPAECSVLATLGYASVPVYRRPRIGVISSGDELVAVDAPAGPAQVRDSNRYAVAASLQAKGAQVMVFPVVPDVPGALEAALSSALPGCDAIMLTGGSSVGQRDFTPGAIAALGEPGVLVHGLRVKPGKPTVLAAAGAKPIIGLPGNPTSALIILEAVIAPVIAALTGCTQRAFTVDAVAREAIPGRAGWTWYVPVSLFDDGERYMAAPLPIRSASTSLPARADGFLTMEEDVTQIECGQGVRITRLTEGLC